MHENYLGYLWQIQIPRVHIRPLTREWEWGVGSGEGAGVGWGGQKSAFLKSALT